MKNSIIYIFLITLLLTFGCKKVESKTTKNDNTDQNTTGLSKNELIAKLGGNITKEPTKITEAEFMNMILAIRRRLWNENMKN